MDISGTHWRRISVRLVGTHSPGTILVGLADQKDWSPCRRYRPLSAGTPSDLFRPHSCFVHNSNREGNFFRAVGAAIGTIAFYTKARREERFLRLELGEGAYDAYARKTAMLVPFKVRLRSGDTAHP